MLQLESSWHGRSVDHVLTYSGRQNRGRVSETFTNYEAKDLFAQVSQTRRFALYSRTGVVLMLQLESSWHGRSVDHVLTYSDDKSRSGLRNLHELRGKRLVAQVSQTRRFALYSRTGVVLMLQLESSWHGRSVDHVLTYSGRQIEVGSQKTFTNYEAKDLLRKSVDHVLTYSGRQIAVGSQNPSRIMRQKTRCASESNTSVRVVFANRSGFDAPIGVVLAWEERGSCLNIFRTTNRGRVSETFTNYEAKDLLRKSVDHVLTYSGRQIAVGSQKPSRITRQKTCCASESNTSVRVVLANRSGFDAPIGVVLPWEERRSCLNIFRITNHGRISETFTSYEAKDLLRKSCLIIIRTINRGRVLETFTNYEPKDLLRNRVKHIRFALYSQIGVVLLLQLESSWHWRSVDHVLTYSGRQIEFGSQKPSRITRQKTCCASESNTSVRDEFANRNGFDAPIGVVLAWEERGPCLNIFRTTNRGRVSETFTNYEAKDLLRKRVKHVGSRLFANRNGFVAPIGVVLAWEELGSHLNIFWMNNRDRVSETFTIYEAKDLLRNVDHVLTYSGLQIAVGSQKLSRVTRQKTCCATWEERRSCLNIIWTTNRGRISETFTNYEAKDLSRIRDKHERGSRLNIFRTKNRGLISEKLTNYEAKGLLRNESNTSVRVVFANRSGFDAPIGVVLAWEERGSCLNIFRTTNRGRVSETFTNYEAKDLLRKSIDHVLTYSGRQIGVGSQKPSPITRQNTCCARESNKSVRVVFANLSGFDAPIGVVLACEELSQTRQVRVVFANRSGFDAPIGVVLAWEERGSCLNIFRTTNRVRLSETFTNYEAKELLRKSVDHVLTYFGRQIAVGSQKPSRITRQKTCCASESNTSVRVVFANRSGFDAPIGVVLAWEERGSCLNIFRTTNRGRVSETFTNYEAKDLLRKSVDHVLTYSGRQIAVGSQKPSRITRQKTCCASESNTSVRVVFANRSGFDAPIGVVLAWEERGSCLNIFRTTNCGRLSETFTNYKAKDLLQK
ncbi:uncharacterized protein G2W53_045179 [Senna tora]|uniref:Uncharacterized protein n=1 Tax=Senna tora TaxID=362788 RepID=A0A834SC32_9FABA|nr:uncharacterized protein G2W53_045179 [Senna tora]